MGLESFTWWMWLLLGLGLMALEMVTPGGFFVLFFGIGAASVGLLDFAGLHLSFPIQGLLFVTIAVVSIVLFRKPLQQRFQGNMPKGKVDNLVGETACALEDIPVDGIGKAELRGSAWNAHNIGDAPIPGSARCRVERVDGLTLHVRS